MAPKQRPQPPKPRAWPDRRDIERAIDERRALGLQRRASMDAHAAAVRESRFGPGAIVGVQSRPQW
jgi:hypothetical protein